MINAISSRSDANMDTIFAEEEKGLQHQYLWIADAVLFVFYTIAIL